MREIDKLAFFTAAIIVFVVFIAGLMIGWAYTKMLNEKTIDEINDLSSKIALLQALSTRDDLEFCSMFNYLFPKLEEISWRLGEKIDYLENQDKVDNKLKNLYFEYLYRDYLLLKLAKERCGYKVIHIIYFYYNNQSKPCDKCYYQGFELSEARFKLKERGINIRVYSFDGKLEGLGEYLAKLYNISAYPTLIIENITLIDLVKAEQIVQIVQNELQS